MIIFGRVKEARGAAWPLSALFSVSESDVLLQGWSRHPKGTRVPKQPVKVNSTKENT